jgi:hypothetical protein
MNIKANVTFKKASFSISNTRIFSYDRIVMITRSAHKIVLDLVCSFIIDELAAVS